MQNNFQPWALWMYSSKKLEILTLCCVYCVYQWELQIISVKQLISFGSKEGSQYTYNSYNSAKVSDLSQSVTFHHFIYSMGFSHNPHKPNTICTIGNCSFCYNICKGHQRGKDLCISKETITSPSSRVTLFLKSYQR